MLRRFAWPRKRGLSEKIAVLVALLIGVSLTTMTVTNIWSGQRLLEDRARQRALDIAGLVANASSTYLYDLRADEIETLTRGVEAQPDVLFAYVLDSDDMLLTDSDAVGERYDIVDDRLSQRARSEQRALIDIDQTGFHVAAPIHLGGEALGIARLGISRASLDQDLSNLRRQSLLVGLAFLVLGLMTSRAVVLRTVRPLRKLTIATKAITGGELDRRIAIDTNDEVQELAEAFNQMTTSLNAKDAALGQRISDLALAQQQLRQANQDLENRVAARTRDLESALATAQEATRLKSEFLANMSHEIRTPINGVLGMAELLTKSGLDGKRKHFADTILDSATSLLGTINDILDFSKIEADKLDLDNTSFDLRELVEDVGQQLSAMAHRKKLELICHVALDVHTAVRGDAQRLRQILVNLIGNAIKFTEQGQVVVRVVRSNSADCHQILFEVHDTGVGISADAQAHIFDSFTQADGSTTRQFGGTGLGLAISQRLVALMGGEIVVESELGQGAVFRFSAIFDRESQPPRGNTDDKALDGLKVLIVDDNDTNREILDRQLEAWQVDHACAANGTSALDLLRRAALEGQAFDLVLVDRFMPSMDGFRLAKLIREDTDLAATRLVLLSSMTPDKTTTEWQSSAFTSSLTKPLRQADLHRCLQSIVRGKCSSMVASGEIEVDRQPEVTITARVLVAEDNKVNQDVIEESLSQLGCQVTMVRAPFKPANATMSI